MLSRALRILLWVVAVLIAVPVALVAFVATGPGGRLLGNAVGSLSSGLAKVHGLSVSLPDGLHAARIEVADAQGVWLVIEDVDMAWSPAALLSHALDVDRLHAARVAVARLPVSSQGGGSGQASLPGRVDIKSLKLDRVELAPPVAGKAAVLAVTGTARLDSLQAGHARLDVTRQDGAGHYAIDASSDGTKVSARLDAQEPEGGLVGGIAGLPALGALDAHATAEGGLDALAVQARLGAGPLHATLDGVVDLPGRSGRLDVEATAPAMAPRPGLRFQSASLQAHVEGPFAAPRGSGNLRLEGLEADGVAVATVTAEATASDGRVKATAALAGLAVPGVEALAKAPVRITLEGPFDGPLAVTLTHPLVRLSGTGSPDGSGDMRLELPDLAGLRGLTGLDLAGSAAVAARLRWQGDALAVDANGSLALTAAPAPAVALLGPHATFTASGTLRGVDVSGGRFTLSGQALQVTLAGDWKNAVAAATWQVALPDLHALVPTLAGNVHIDGKVAGAADDLAVQAHAAGDAAVGGGATTPVTAQADLRGLPLHPSGSVSVGGMLDGAPVSLDATLARAADGTLRFDMSRAGWKSGSAEAHLVWPAGAALPQGRVNLSMPALSDVGQVLGMGLAGGVEASASLEGGEAAVTLKLSDARLPGAASVASAALSATVHDPMGARELDGTLKVAGLQVGGMAADFTLQAAGPAEHVDLKLDGTTALQGDAAKFSAAATLNAMVPALDLRQLRGTWRGETVALAAPAHVDMANGVTVDQLRLGLRGAALELAGRLAPTLDLTASLRDLPLDLAQLAAPSANLEGTVQGTARLTGTLAAPAGRVELSGSGVRLQGGLGAALKPASFTATATLSGGAARLDAKAETGDTNIALAGTVPIGAGPIDLRVTGRSGLSALDTVLAAGGRRLRGSLVLDATLGGTLAAPRVGGRVSLSGGDLQDRTLGVRIRNLAAEAVGDGATIRLVRLTGQAGAGTIAANGTLGLDGNMPVRLDLTLRQARLLASTLVTGTVDAGLAVTGALADGIAVGGTVTLGRTDINVPEQLPPSVAVLNVRRPGEKPPPPQAPPLPVALDVTLKAPGQIFLRGRGIDAELQGQLHIGGDAADIRPEGGFTLRRGSFTLAGVVLQFTSGTVTLDGSLPIDPRLDLKATTSTTGTAGTIVATVAITGRVSKPVVTLSSVPELPSDEVLAQLLFNRGTSALGPVELAQLASALAELSGVGPKVAPLEALRSKLGLDRLSVGAGSNGTGASVQAGRTIAPGVYLGAKQNTGSGGTQATVEIDLYKGLKLKADVGTGGDTSATGASGSSGTGVGLTYQFEY